MNRPTFFIVPGFKQKATGKGFTWLRQYLQKKNFNVIPVPINWPRRVMSDYIEDFKSCYQKNKSQPNYILGFSYGAVIAFSTASELNPDKIFLCSLSPDFKEDLSAMKPDMKKYIGRKRLKDSSSRSGKKIAQELKVPSIIFYGEKEGKQYPQLKLRCEETVKLAKDSKLVVVQKSPHKIDTPAYVKSIKNELENL